MVEPQHAFLALAKISLT